MAIEFNHFSPQAFERMVQALCVSVLGPGVLIFGAGADGGREATFEGEVAYPSAADRWNGYVVMQAKCRERLRNNYEDANWLCEQLRHDLDKFLDPKRNLRIPQYYILASNVTLSPEDKKGGKAKVDAVFKSYERNLRLKSYAVWSADELRVYLENATDVRRAYTAWLTPSDVLADLVNSLKRPSLSRVLPLALARDLRHERDVRLKDAGQETDKAIYLEDVFVDLPLVAEGHPSSGLNLNVEFTGRNNVDPASEEQRPPTNTLCQILLRASEKFDLKSTLFSPTDQVIVKQGPQRNRIVLLGGPGQGKSTLSQFLAQIERARMLRTCEAARTNPQTLDLIPPILDRAESEGLWLDGPTRFPIRIDLPGFADTLKQADDGKQSVSLIAYAASRLSRDVDVGISADELRLWLGTCPSLIILDGLDEVPPTGNRDHVVRAIDALWDDLHLVVADALVVVTTRPQGYNNDLDRQYWEHWELAPLEPQHMTRYAESLARVRLSDPDERVAIVNTLRSGAADASTSTLLTSPLQVAILFGIALLIKVIPRDRWELFHRYYTIVFDREARKPNSIVGEFKQQIDALHHQAGFLLHVAAESAGNANAFFTTPQLRALIERLLQRDGFDKGKIQTISSELMRVSTQRLVLLAQKVEGRIAFDVRSLQEFMAAAQLASASQIPISERMRAIAGRAHWDHVLRIVASKIFSLSELSYYRNDVLSLCHSLNSGDLGAEARLLRSGSTLALDLLTDGVAAHAPIFRDHFVRCALSLLDTGLDSSQIARLINQLNAETFDIFNDQLVSRLRQKITLSAQSAWKLSCAILPFDTQPVQAILLDNWPNEPVNALEQAAAVHVKDLPPRLQAKLLNDQLAAGPQNTKQFIETQEFVREGLEPDQREFRYLTYSRLFALPVPYVDIRSLPYGAGKFRAAILSHGTGGIVRPTDIVLSAELNSIHITNTSFVLSRHADHYPPSWDFVRAVSEFEKEPSNATLVGFINSLDTMGSRSTSSVSLLVPTLPWLLITLATEYEEGAAIERLANEARQGKFGELKDWQTAERRWRAKGFEAGDFLSWNSGRYIVPDIADRGAPCLSSYLSNFGDCAPSKVESLFDVALAIVPEAKRYNLFTVLLFGVGLNSLSPGSHEKLRSLVDGLMDRHAEKLASRIFQLYNLSAHDGWLVAKLDQLGRVLPRPIRAPGSIDISYLVGAFNEDPSRRGLLPILFFQVNMGAREDASDIDQLNSSAFEERSDDEPIVQLTVALLRIMTNKWGKADVPCLIKLLLSPDLVKFSESIVENLKTVSTRVNLGNGKLLESLVSRSFESQHPRYRSFRELLSGEQDSKRSILIEESERGRLQLPAMP